MFSVLLICFKAHYFIKTSDYNCFFRANLKKNGFKLQK